MSAANEESSREAATLSAELCGRIGYADLMRLAKDAGLGPENVSGLLQARLELFGRAVEREARAAEQERCARLMAAAPEMLEALTQLLAEAESLREGYSNSREFEGWDGVDEEPCFALARAAIAKATLTPNAEITGG